MPILVFALLCAEIALLIKFGQAMGGGPVLAEILFSAVLGLIILRRAGRVVLRSSDLIALLARPSIRLRLPSWGLVFAGILLLIPGMLSDVLGLGLAIRYVWPTRRTPRRPCSKQDQDVIDVKYRVHSDHSSE
jgi:UPF0716 protein FxsA